MPDARTPAAGFRRTVGAAVCVAYGLVLSGTRPFTVPADVLVALPLAVAAGLVAWRWRTGRRRAPAAGVVPGRSRWWALWASLAGAVLGWELACFARGPRHAYPTLSALLDSLDASRAGKPAAAGAWLALGWFLVRR